MAEPAEQGPYRSQSTTSLSRLYHGANGYSGGDEGELSDPRLDFCNAFWGHGDKGYEVMMARLRGAARTMEELKSFGRERAAIEEEYAKKLAKLAKAPLGKDEIGDLAASLQNVQSETANQASYHLSLATELRQNVEQPTAEFVARLANLKKGLQASVEKSYKNKGLQEGHVLKAKDRYESDCLKLNSYTANAALSQGKDLEKINSKLERVRQTIGANEQDFRQFVKVLEGTTAKWESEWKAFCDHVQDLEEDRLALTKDIVWAYANAVSQVCVEDDSSCERVREKLEQFEPQNDMLNFVRGWGTGDTIPNPPRFVNYSAGESYPSQPGAHVANFRRLSSKPPPSASSQQPLNLQAMPVEQAEEPPMEKEAETNGWANGISKLSLNDEPKPVEKAKAPVGGVALPGMTAPAPAAASATASRPDRTSSMPPPPVPPAMTMPEPRVPSRQSTRDMNEDPMAKALAELRREPPPSGSVRRNASQRRPESVYSTTASSAKGGSNIKSPPSPGPGAANRMSYQQAPSRDARGSVDMTLSPPAPGHTAAQLQKSMDDFHRQSQAKRGSVNYSNYANDVVGAHPSSRPSSPAPGSRGPSSAMMQPPIQPPSPVADEVLSQYHQAFPGERSRSRAGSITSGRSRAGSFVGQPPANIPQSPSAAPREGFVGIGAGGGRSPSPQPPAFRSPSPSPVVSHAPGVLGPQNLGIALDEKGGVAHDSMAEAYRRQYQQQQAQQQSSSRPGRAPSPAPIQSPRSPVYAQQPQQQQQQQQQQYPAAQQAPYGQQAYVPAQLPPKSPVQNLPPSISTQTRPMSGFASQSAQGYQTAVPPPQVHAQQPYQPQQSQQQYPGYQSPQQQPGFTPYGQQPSYQSPPVPQAQPAAYQSNGYGQQPPPQQQPQRQSTYGAPQQQYQPPPQQQQQQQYARAPSPAPQPQPQQQQQYYAGPPSPQPGYGSQQAHGRSPSPQPNRPPENTAPTGQWSTTGQPVLFYVKALYDYQACSPAEFDFQAGDIIAVTSTPEDGWWSGELLDEARRRPGQTDFPSNFVCLF